MDRRERASRISFAMTLIVSALIAVLGSSGSATASLIGDTVGGSGVLGVGTGFDTTATVVDPGREFAGTFLNFSTIFADLKDDELTVGYEANMPGNVHHTPGGAFEFRFTDLDRGARRDRRLASSRCDSGAG